jgi:hypothetical protein
MTGLLRVRYVNSRAVGISRGTTSQDGHARP